MPIFQLVSEHEFECVIEEGLGLFRGLSRRILQNADDADDAVQRAFLKAWNHRLFLRKPECLKGWIARIVVNESYSILRRRKKENTVPLDDVPELTGTPEATDCENLRKLDEALAALPELYRQTVHIALLSGLDSDEAARILGVSLNTLYQRIHKAKQFLREKMNHE